MHLSAIPIVVASKSTHFTNFSSKVMRKVMLQARPQQATGAARAAQTKLSELEKLRSEGALERRYLMGI
jgi:hypothetical protein